MVDVLANAPHGERASPEARSRGGRQVEKSQRTRERVLAATIELIRKEGLASASPLRIARRAGMSTGAVQHHFGSKEELLRTIVQMCKAEWRRTVADANSAGWVKADRATNFVDLAWGYYNGDLFLATVEILLRCRNEPIGAGDIEFFIFSEMDDDFRGLFRSLLTDGDLPDSQVQEAVRYVHCFMLGLAYQTILAASDPGVDRYLAICAATVRTLLTPAASGPMTSARVPQCLGDAP